jgi:nucleoside-diphosphate-sugar epimerase
MALSGERILITGATGLVGAPLTMYLAQRNEVFGLARFSDQSMQATLRAAGAQLIQADLRDVDRDTIPEGLDYVIHAGAILPAKGAERSRNETFQTNVQATGRLMRHVGPVKGFVHCSSGSVYAYQGQRPLNEDDPYGLHNNIPTYAASKIAAESLVEFLSREAGIPTSIVRIFTVYGPQGGTVSARIDMVARGEPVPVFPGGPNQQTPMYVDDAVEKAETAATLATVPPLVVNFAGSETASVQEYTTMAADLLGVDVSFRESDTAYYPIWADVTKMHETLGRCRVGVAEGVRRVVESSGHRTQANVPG